MTDTNIYNTQLTEEKTKLEAELAGIGRKNPQNPADWEATPGAIDPTATEPDERADNIEELEANEGIVSALEKRLANVNRALQKIANGTYGTCEISGEPIEEGRLNANPAARTCTAHMGEEETFS